MLLVCLLSLIPRAILIEAHLIKQTLRGNLLLVTSLEGRSQSFKSDRAQLGPLTALLRYLNVLLEYFDFFKFSLAGHNQHLGGPGPPLATPHASLQVVITIK